MLADVSTIESEYPLAIFICQVFKEGLGEKWSNRYLFDASSLAACEPLVAPIVDREKSIHKSTVTITQVRVSDQVAANDNFFTVPVNEPGDVTATAALLPLFNRVRVDIDVDGFGRPSRKYYCLPLAEDEQADGILGSLTGLAIQAAVNLMITEVDTAGGGDGEICDPDGQAWVTATYQAKVAMHQMHRRRRRSP